MQVECIKCHRRRGKQFMQEAVFLGFANEPAGVYKCASNSSCKKARKPCGKCGHLLRHHQKIDRWFDGNPGRYCLYNMGMGDPCGCDHYNK